MVAALPPSVPTGKPTNAEFPTAASTPPVNIMTPEPPLGARRPSTAAAPQPRRVRPRRRRRPAQAAAKKPRAEAAVQHRAGPARAVGRGAHS